MIVCFYFFVDVLIYVYSGSTRLYLEGGNVACQPPLDCISVHRVPGIGLTARCSTSVCFFTDLPPLHCFQILSVYRFKYSLLFPLFMFNIYSIFWENIDNLCVDRSYKFHCPPLLMRTVLVRFVNGLGILISSHCRLRAAFADYVRALFTSGVRRY